MNYNNKRSQNIYLYFQKSTQHTCRSEDACTSAVGNTFDRDSPEISLQLPKVDSSKLVCAKGRKRKHSNEKVCYTVLILHLIISKHIDEKKARQMISVTTIIIL